MANTRLTLPRPLVNTLLAQAQTSPDHEICGLIGRTIIDDTMPATEAYPIDNIAAEPAHRYEMDPAQQIDALRTMRDHQQELYCIYHSHPASPARPSAIDMREAQYPDCIYLIISLNTQGVIEMRAFYIDAPDNYREITLDVTD